MRRSGELVDLAPDRSGKRTTAKGNPTGNNAANQH